MVYATPVFDKIVCHHSPCYFVAIQKGITVQNSIFHQIFILLFSSHEVILKICWTFFLTIYSFFQVMLVIFFSVKKLEYLI